MSFYEKAVAGSSKLSRGQVWCLTCGRTRRVDSAECLQRDGPKCSACGGYTMSLDSPDERKEQDRKSALKGKSNADNQRSTQRN